MAASGAWPRATSAMILVDMSTSQANPTQNVTAPMTSANGMRTSATFNNRTPFIDTRRYDSSETLRTGQFFPRLPANGGGGVRQTTTATLMEAGSRWAAKAASIACRGN